MAEFFATVIVALGVLVSTWGASISSATENVLDFFGSRREVYVAESPAPTPDPTQSPFVLATPSPEATPMPTETPEPTPSPSPAPKPTPRLTPSPKPAPLQKPKPTPAATPAPTLLPTASPTPAPIPLPDFTVGTILITDYTKPSVRIGEPFPFKIFVRDENDVIVKNKTFTVLLNGKAYGTTTDVYAKAPLEFAETHTPGKTIVTVQLGNKSASVTIDVLDTKPDLARSPLGCTQDGCHLRLGNEAGDWIPGWLAIARSPTDAAYLAQTKTDALGLATFPLPPRMPPEIACPAPDATTYCICVEVQNIGTKCGGF